MLRVCICTHNPRRDVFAKVLQALAAQSCGPEAFDVTIVDNGSDPPIHDQWCRQMLGPDIRFRLEQEPILGLCHAQVHAFKMTEGPWVLMVDDDNELFPDFIENGLSIIEKNPELGCFGGRLLLPDYLKPAPWLLPMLPWLAIRDGGPDPVTRISDEWGIWSPPAAGAFVRRPLVDRYISIMEANDAATQLGRKGSKTLNSGEDSLMMFGAYVLGYSSSYQPTLRLNHHLSSSRFRLKYLLRLMYGYGRSHIILERVQNKIPYINTEKLNIIEKMSWIFENFNEDRIKSFKYACCMAIFRVGYLKEKMGIF